MKTKIIPLFFLVVFVLSCEDTTYREYKGNAPVYISYEDLRSSVSEVENVDLNDPGKIYFKDNFIFIIEELRGIHVFNNANPASPEKIVFIKLPGVMDMAISGNVLYADSFVDLVILDVQDVDNIREVGRIKDILPYILPPVDNDLPQGNVDREKGLVTGWEVKTIKERIYENPVVYPMFRSDMMMLNSATYSSGSSGISSGGVGIGGSMARFGIKNNILYILNNSTLELLDISDRTNPASISEISAGWGIETMFLTENNMFLGTTTGMIIYDISNPQLPVRKSTFSHARSCDPVVVDDTLAYVTLRSGTNCGGAINLLSVVNIKNLSAPSLVKSYAMINPHGLGKDGNLLFICDGSAGLKIYDASNPRELSSHLIYTYPGIKAYDVIPIGEVLVMIGDDGLFQYDYKDVQNISLLSTISVVKE